MVAIPLWVLLLLCLTPLLITPLLIWIAGRAQRDLVALFNAMNSNQRDDMRMLQVAVNDMIDRLDRERARSQADRAIHQRIMGDIHELDRTDRKHTRAIQALTKMAEGAKK